MCFLYLQHIEYIEYIQYIEYTDAFPIFSISYPDKNTNKNRGELVAHGHIALKHLHTNRFSEIRIGLGQFKLYLIQTRWKHDFLRIVFDNLIVGKNQN